MKKKNKIFITTARIFIAATYLLLQGSITSIYSQTVYEPLYNDVYKFLSRLSQKGIIEFNDQIKPVSREYIAKLLLDARWKMVNGKPEPKNITNLEKEELEFYLKDYWLEYSFKLRPSNSDSLISLNNKAEVNIANSNSGRLRLFNYSDSLFKINVSPILGYELGSNDGKSYSHRWNGIYLYGYLTDNIGFSFDFRDNSETGDNIDRTKAFTPVTGITIAAGSGNNIQYSEIKTTISASWNWGNFTIGKDFLEWGYGESGKLVLSQKAPSSPFIRLDINPVPWLKFNYIHAWLASDVVDSSAIYTSLIRGENFDRIQFRKKYLASHTVTISPLKGLDISFGESIVYSDRLEISYLMPLMFFRLADHYLSKANNNAGDNSQFFLGISSRNHIKNTHLYGTLFIDEISTEAFGNSKDERNQFGFTLGGSIVDLPIDNLTLTAEYTKIYPFVYRHYIQTQTYASSSYVLGHWMGDNADLIYCSLNYRFLRGLQATVWGEYIRKGGEGKPVDQYTQPQPPFLFGLNSRFTYAGVEVKYEIMHEFFVRSRLTINKINHDLDNGGKIKTDYSEFYFALYYGL